MTSIDNLKTILGISDSLIGKTEFVSYVGNGKWGINYPNSIAFSGIPKIVMLLYCVDTAGNVNILFGSPAGSSFVYPAIAYPTALTNEFKIYGMFGYNSGNSNVYLKFDNISNTLYWYSYYVWNVERPEEDWSNNQYNKNKSTYYALAIF